MRNCSRHLSRRDRPLAFPWWRAPSARAACHRLYIRHRVRCEVDGGAHAGFLAPPVASRSFYRVSLLARAFGARLLSSLIIMGYLVRCEVNGSPMRNCSRHQSRRDRLLAFPCWRAPSARASCPLLYSSYLVRCEVNGGGGMPCATTRAAIVLSRFLVGARLRRAPPVLCYILIIWCAARSMRAPMRDSSRHQLRRDSPLTFPCWRAPSAGDICSRW